LERQACAYPRFFSVRRLCFSRSASSRPQPRSRRFSSRTDMDTSAASENLSASCGGRAQGSGSRPRSQSQTAPESGKPLPRLPPLPECWLFYRIYLSPHPIPGPAMPQWPWLPDLRRIRHAPKCLKGRGERNAHPNAAHPSAAHRGPDRTRPANTPLFPVLKPSIL
jgi:hypothetical protein